MNDHIQAVPREDLERRPKRGLGKGVGVESHKQGAVDADLPAVLADGLGRGGDMGLVEGPGQGRAPVPGRAEGDAAQRFVREVGRYQPGHMDPHGRWGRLSCKIVGSHVDPLLFPRPAMASGPGRAFEGPLPYSVRKRPVEGKNRLSKPYDMVCVGRPPRPFQQTAKAFTNKPGPWGQSNLTPGGQPRFAAEKANPAPPGIPWTESFPLLLRSCSPRSCTEGIAWLLRRDGAKVYVRERRMLHPNAILHLARPHRPSGHAPLLRMAPALCGHPPLHHLGLSGRRGRPCGTTVQSGDRVRGGGGPPLRQAHLSAAHGLFRLHGHSAGFSLLDPGGHRVHGPVRGPIPC